MLKPIIIAIVGPTAVGKTGAAIQVCRAFDGEVISMDSMQIYRGMDIGTAKPSMAEREGIPHHLLSVCETSEAFTVTDYKAQAEAVIDKLISKGKCPVLAGGTGLYLNALTYEMNMAEVPADEAFRASLLEQAEKHGEKERLHDRLKQVDPQSAARLHPNDVRRVIRALEVYHITGKTMDEYREDFKNQEGQYTPLIYGLTMPREKLYARINERVDQMMENGLLEEVRGILSRSDLPPGNDGAMQAIGYKELARVIHGECTLEKAIDDIKLASRRYAKRQLTWFTRDARVVWFDCSQYSDTASLLEALRARIASDMAQAKEKTC